MALDAIKSTPDSLTSWLSYAEKLTEKPIELGLMRMRTMIARMGISFSCPVFTVAGTNGKGSTCALISSVLLSAGYRVGMHTSPHLLRFNERSSAVKKWKILSCAEPLIKSIVLVTGCRLRILNLRALQF